jgi:hypothetical protein
MKDDNCVVMSIGSHNEWDFEEAVIAKYPNCRIHTLDCYADGHVPEAIKNQVTFHPVCLVVENQVIAGHRFMTWLSVVKELGLTKATTAMNMDSGVAVPRQAICWETEESCGFMRKKRASARHNLECKRLGQY